MTFLKWLKLQKDRDDPVGDLAQDWIRDKCPKNFSILYLRGKSACLEALEAFREAKAEWLKHEMEITPKTKAI